MGLLSKAATGSFVPDTEAVVSTETAGSYGLDIQFDKIEQYIPEQDNPEEPGTGNGLLSLITRKFAHSPSAAEKAVMDSFNSGYAKFGSLQGIVIDTLEYAADEFLTRLESLVSGFAVSRDLAPGRCLVLFGASQDGELITRHLEKTVPGNSVFMFHAENPQDALLLLKPYL
jgi:hypothetical protein